MSQAKPRTAIIVSIGNELLSGKVIDTNAPFLIRRLRDLGVAVLGTATIADDVPVIARTLRALSPKADVLFTSGGIGPTHDDVTLEGTAKAFGLKLARNSKLVLGLKRFYGHGANEAVLKMADVPQGARLIQDPTFPVPVFLVRNVYVLPGDPGFFQKKFLSIEERFRTDPFYLKKIFIRAEEGDIADLLRSAEKRRAGVRIGSYPRYDPGRDHSVMITVESRNPRLTDEIFRFVKTGLPKGSLIRVE